MDVSNFKVEIRADLMAMGSPKALGPNTAVPAPFTAVFTNESLELTIVVDVANGVPFCPEYHLKRVDAPPGLEMATTDVLRGIPLRGLMANALARVALEVERTETGVRFDYRSPTSVEAVEAVIGSLKRRRQPVTDEVLREFADAYRERFEPGAMEEFADSIGYSPRHAYRLKKLAEERGFLGGNDGER